MFDWGLLKFPSLTTNGLLTVINGDGTISVDTSIYLAKVAGNTPFWVDSERDGATGRGVGSVDLQLNSSSDDYICKSECGAIIGGKNNKCETNIYAVVISGYSNISRGLGSVIISGEHNDLHHPQSVAISSSYCESSYDHTAFIGARAKISRTFGEQVYGTYTKSNQVFTEIKGDIQRTLNFWTQKTESADKKYLTSGQPNLIYYPGDDSVNPFPVGYVCAVKLFCLAHREGAFSEGAVWDKIIYMRKKDDTVSGWEYLGGGSSDTEWSANIVDETGGALKLGVELNKVTPNGPISYAFFVKGEADKAYHWNCRSETLEMRQDVSSGSS